MDPYIFVSYSHADSKLVFPDIARLNSEGYRLWFDEGIDPGNEWPDEVARALDSCSYFLVFISSSSVASRNVKNEINFALNKDKKLLAVHIEETNLPLGLALRMGDIQAILRYRMKADFYWERLRSALPSLEEDDTLLYDEAVRLVFEFGKASTALLQRRLRLGYGRAARLLDLMEENGVDWQGPMAPKPRELLKSAHTWLREVGGSLVKKK